MAVLTQVWILGDKQRVSLFANQQVSQIEDNGIHKNFDFLDNVVKLFAVSVPLPVVKIEIR